MAAAGERTPERCQPVLPARHGGVRRAAVLAEEEPSPGLSTRRISRNAAPTSGMVHSVNVQTIVSKLARSAWIYPSSSATTSTGIGIAAARLWARRVMPADGSIPVTG